jgi:RNA polymerase sigma-70 factor (ECF subfamily)
MYDRTPDTEFLHLADDLQHARAATGRFLLRRSLDESDVDVISRAVASAKRGDREALRYLYIRYADNVYSYVATIVPDAHEAEDVTQHVFAKLITVLPKYEERRVAFAAWILRVARNVAIDHLRQLRAIPCEEVRSDEHDHGGGDEDQDRRLLLEQALKELPYEQREVVVLRHVCGLTPPEIAGRLGKSESSVHGLHHRGRGALRAALAGIDAGPAIQMDASAPDLQAA